MFKTGDLKVTINALRGVFVPLWLLARPEIRQGAKLMYVLLAQKASIKGVARPLVPSLALELGEEESRVRQFLAELESYGLIKVQKRPAESGSLQCTFPSHPWAGAVGANGGGDTGAGKRTGLPNSRHSREICIQYAEAKRRAGQGIQNIFALANYFYQTGYHDTELDAFLSKKDMSNESSLEELAEIQ